MASIKTKVSVTEALGSSTLIIQVTGAPRAKLRWALMLAILKLAGLASPFARVRIEVEDDPPSRQPVK